MYVQHGRLPVNELASDAKGHGVREAYVKEAAKLLPEIETLGAYVGGFAAEEAGGPKSPSRSGAADKGGYGAELLSFFGARDVDRAGGGVAAFGEDEHVEQGLDRFLLEAVLSTCSNPTVAISLAAQVLQRFEHSSCKSARCQCARADPSPVVVRGCAVGRSWDDADSAG